MARLPKDYDTRRKNIADKAMNLFLINGYEETSVNMIIKDIGISKGAFYHYYNSKEDLLEAIVDGKSKEVLAIITTIINDSSLNAIDKLNSIYQHVIRVKADMQGLMQKFFQVWMNDEYLLIRHKMEWRNIEVLGVEIKKIVVQGIKEDLFHLDTTEGIEILLLKFGTIMNDLILKLFKDSKMKPTKQQLSDIVNLYQLSLERILGAPNGSIRIFDIDALIRIIS